MKRTLFYIVAGLSMLSAAVSSCDTEYDLDIPDGWDTNKGDASNVTVDTLVGIDVSQYDKARIFPGLPDTLREAHIDTVLHLDLSKPYVGREVYRFTSPVIGNRGDNMPQPIYSTGCYAGAGELIKIEIPAGNIYGLSVQIGSQTDELPSGASYFREPIAYTRKSLSSGTNYVRFPLGGYIWIIREPKAIGPADVELTIRNAYRAPDFVSGTTNPDQWIKNIQISTVPWLEIRSERMAISLDRERVNQFIQADNQFANKLSNTLNEWDKVIEYIYESFGLSADAENPQDAMPKFPLRFIFDVQLNLSGNNVLLHNNNTQGVAMVKTTRLYNELIDNQTVNATDFFSIYNTLLDRYTLTYSAGGTLATNSAKLVAAYRHAESMYRMSFSPVMDDLTCQFDVIAKDALAYAVSGNSKNYTVDKWSEDSESKYRTLAHRLTMLAQLGNYDLLKGLPAWAGYFSWRKSVREGKAMFNNETEESSMFRAMCDFYKENLTPFYEHWGVLLCDNDREYATRYPLPDKKIWEGNIFDKNGVFSKAGNYAKASFRFRNNRAGWTIYATDSSYVHDNYDMEYSDSKDHKTPENLLDGSRSTIWRSYLAKNDKNLGGQDSPYSLPYYIIIDMQKSLPIDGFFFINGNISKFIVQTTDASDIELSDENVNWRTIGSVSQSQGFHPNEQFVDFGSRITARYLRIVISEVNLSQLKPDASQSEIDKYNNLHQNRKMEFSEFGTYYYQK